MKKTLKTKGGWRRGLWLVLAVLLAMAAEASTTNTYYVVSGNPTPLPPFGAWGDAAADIQTAVDKASADLVPGTTECVVLVSNGTYTLTSQITITNGIALCGFGGRDATFINGNYPAYSNRCIEIRGSPTRATVDGFTITNGYAYIQRAGGGVFVTNAIASILNCTISRNRSATTTAGNGFGAGIGAINCGSIVITNCLISANTNAAPTTGAGTGAYIYWSKGLLADSQILDNNVFGNGGNGGGAYVSLYNSGLPASDFVVSNCLFAGNYADSAGGLFLSGVIATRCIISNNTARANGGGAALYYMGSTLLTYSTIAGNRAGSGGGISINRGSVYNCKIIGNYAAVSGGGYVSSEGSLRNSLIAGNRADGSGGGVSWILKNNSFNMVNCTIVRNSAGVAGGGVNTAATDSNVFINVIVSGNQAGVSNDLAGIIARTNFIYSCSPDLAEGVSGNITNAPLFADVGSGYGTNAVLGDYTLQTNSPCLGSGWNQSWMTTDPLTDLAGNTRIRPAWGTVDMGAYEAYSWPGALTNNFMASPVTGAAPLQVSLTGETSGNTNGLLYQWVFGDGAISAWSAASMASHSYAARTNAYTVTLNVTNDAGEAGSLTLTDYIMVYPPIVYVATNGLHVAPFETWGNAATNIQSAIDVAGAGYSTVLINTGLYLVRTNINITKAITVRSVSTNWDDVIVRGGYPATTNRCFYMNSANAVLDGLTVTNGRLPATSQGGGIYMLAGTVQNCRVIGNATFNYHGGGISMGSGSVLNCAILNNNAGNQSGGGISMNGTVRNCVIAGNSALPGYGGGVSIEAGRLVDCIVSNNAAKIGGGVYHRNGVGYVSNCVIVANSATQVGGGVGFAAASDGGTFRTCLIAGNAAVTNGGGVALSVSLTGFENCTIVGNSAGIGGGWHQTAPGTGVNCIVYFNQATNAPAAFADVASTATNNLGSIVTNLAFSCSPWLPVGGAGGNVAADPMFVSVGSGYGTNLVAGNYHLKAGSPCIDTGTNLSWMAGTLDLEGYSRILGAGPNMGVYEKTIPGRGSLLLIR